MNIKLKLMVFGTKPTLNRSQEVFIAKVGVNDTSQMHVTPAYKMTYTSWLNTN